MKIHFSKEHLNPKERRLQRLFEIIPGATTWSILIGMTILSLIKPLWAAMIIIAFDLYWLLKLVYMTIFLLLAYFRLKTEEETQRSEEHTSELQSRLHLVCRLLLEK